MSSSQAATDLIEKYYVAVDSKDLAGSMECWADGARLQWVNEPVIEGLEGIELTTKNLFDSFASLQHRFEVTEIEPGTALCEGTITFGTHDGREVAVRGVLIGIFRDKKWVEQRIYTDLAPVISPAPAGGEV